jgi:hypothetical protein
VSLWGIAAQGIQDDRCKNRSYCSYTCPVQKVRAGLAGSGSPVIKLLEAKVEMLRNALAAVASALAADLQKHPTPRA